MPKSKALILEKDKLRGEVPSRTYGRKDEAYNTYLNELNPRENQAVQLALASSQDPRFMGFLERLAGPTYKRYSLAAIAKGCGIDLLEFQKWWSKASSQQAIAICQTRSLGIAEDMADDAQTTRMACPRCDGLQFVEAPAGLPKGIPGYRQIKLGGNEVWVRKCPDCTDGTVRKPGDSHARDRVLEMGGLIQKNKGAVVINQNFGGASHSSAIQDLDEAMSIDVDSERM